MSFGAIRTFLIALIAVIFYRLYSWLWRFEHIRMPKCGVDGSAVVFAHWHGDELLLIGAYIRKRMAIMASRSRDGEIMTRMMTWLGFRVVRGSSTRGGAGGLKGLIDVVQKEGYRASLAVDGPRGPIYEVKPGILKLAQQTGVPLIPGAASCSRRFVFEKAWNRCYLPLPFSKCIVVYGEPMHIPSEASSEDLEGYRLRLQETLKALKIEAERYFDWQPDSRLVVGSTSGCSAGA